MAGESATIAGYNRKEIHERALLFGLGCGIDATSLKPWESKQAYQVCPVEKLSDIVIRDEGGDWKSYHQKVQTQHQMQSDLTTSLAIPNTPISIGGGMEMSRKSTFSCEIDGRKLVECKVSIRPDSYKFSDEAQEVDFETKLCKWIVDRISYHAAIAFVVMRKMKKVDIQPDDPESAELKWHRENLGLEESAMKLALKAANHKLMEKDKKALEDEFKNPTSSSAPQQQNGQSDFTKFVLDTDWDMLIELCKEFVDTFAVTHFVSAIELGAAKYQVVEETDEVSRKGASFNIDLPSIASASAKRSSEWSKFSKSTKTRKLGVFKDDEKGVDRLAVLDVNILPITERVKSAKLRLALQRVLKNHIDEYYQDVEHQFPKGPFRIVAKGEDENHLYLTVNKMDDHEESSSVAIWRQPQLSPQFSSKNPAPIFLIPVEDGKENEFYIVYYNKPLDVQGGRYVPPPRTKSIPFYLQANLNVLGRDKKMQFVTVPTKECQFIFQPLLGLNGSSIFNDNSFYIKCPQHWSMDGFLHAFPIESEGKADIHASHKKLRQNSNSIFSLEKVIPKGATRTANTESAGGMTYDHGATLQSSVAIDN